MRSEARRVYFDGFLISEQELRRLYDVIIQQMKKTPLGVNFQSEFEVKFRNGIISEPAAIDEIFTLENDGSAAIQRLVIRLFDKEEKPSYGILLTFSNPSAEYIEESMRYQVIGEDRDWVFITSSLVEERIGKIKRFTTQRIVGKNLSRYISNSYTNIIGLFAILFIFSLFMFSSTPSGETIANIEADWRSGKLTDPIEAMIRLQKRVVLPGINSYGQVFLFTTFALSIVIAIIIPLTAFIYSPYVFYWGDGMKGVDRKRSIGNFVLVVIILGVILSVLSNFIYDAIRG